MLFQSLVPRVFQKLNLQADSAANLSRKENTAKRLDFYHDNQLTHLETQLNQLFSDPSKMVKAELNVVKKVINNLAQVYRENPVRLIEGSEKDQELYKQIVEQSSLDIKMKQASRYTKLLKTTLLRPVWRNNLELDILTGNLLDVEIGDSPEDLRKVLICDHGNSDKIQDVEYSSWTPELFQRLDYRGSILYEYDNPYGVLPFLPVWDYSPPSNSFWLSGGDDLISLQKSINLKLVDLLYLMSCQAFGVGWIKGTPGGGNLQVDPGSLVELGEDGAIGFESQEAEISQVVEAIDKIIKWACVSNGLSASSMSTEASEASGLSKLVDTRELSEMRQDDIALFRSYERQLFNLMRIVFNTHSKDKLSDSAKLKIDFADPEIQVDPKTQAQADDIRLAQGTISAVDIAMQQDADLKTREDALAHLIKIKEETRQLLE